MCLRLLQDDLALSANELKLNIDQRLKQLGSKREDCDLIIDMKRVGSTDIHSRTALAVQFFCEKSLAADWKSITLASSAFPYPVVGVKRGALGEIPRSDYLLWAQVCHNPKVTRLPIFGDYGIVSADFPEEANFGLIKIIPKIRYATDSSWLVAKADSSKPPRRDHFQKLSRKLAAHSAFKGGSYSWGDEFIANCAAASDGSGALSKWVSIDWNHHITHVVNQLSN